MKKNIVRIAALLLIVASLVLCIPSCGEKVNKINVTVAIYELSDGEKSIWLGRQMELEEGKTADEAVERLCELGDATYTKDNSGMYDSFKRSKGSIKLPSTKTLADGTTEYYHFGWSLNGETMSNIDDFKSLSSHVMVEGDSVEIFIQKDIVAAQ